MILSDVSITRPVLAAVVSLLLIVFGLVSFERLPLREYPDIDPPVVSVETLYQGAAANVIETRVTELIEGRISGVEGIRFIESSSEDGRSMINIEFDIGRDIDGAANDIRDRVSSILDDLPEEADPPEIQKVDTNEEVIMWLNLVSDRMSVPELTDYADRYLVDRFSVLDGVALGDALESLEQIVKEHLPGNVIVDYKGQSQDFKFAGKSIVFTFVLGIVVVFLVLAAQFESWVHPLVIMLTVPLAMAGALLGLYLTGQTLNLYSQIGLIMLVGLAAKNGILIVEFANQLRDAGKPFHDALVEAAEVRLRPIVMTGITTAAGSIPLLLSSGAGTETRVVIGTVVLSGILAATLFTLFVVPVAYDRMARYTGSPQRVRRRLEAELASHDD
ncbi:MAG: efflux RND transporter permease subunit [Gammaproteobacteria bacterium]|jgi:multidrug efflux pump subunit AcrB